MRIATVFLGAALVAASPTAALPTATAAPATGTVLERSAVPVVDLPSGAVRGVRVLYSTRDQNGRPARSTGVVYYPRGGVPEGGWKVVSWAHGTIGIAPQCSPSTRSGRVQDKRQPTIAGALRRGYVVTASDYIGLGGGGTAEYLGGRSVAYNVIDMVRAARVIDPTIGRRWVSLGHSQGGHAALWAARMAPRYAPELLMRGTVAFAPASQIASIAPAIQSPTAPNLGSLNPLSALGLYILSGLGHARPDLHVERFLTPVGRYWLGRARSTCLDELSPAISRVPPGSLYARPTSSSRAYLAALSTYAGIPSAGYAGPVRLQQGVTDFVVTPVSTAALDGQLRRGGVDVSMRLYPGSHADVVVEAMGDTFATVDRYFR